jgi:transposase InsO family protein
LDDFSRYIIAWKLCTTMKAGDVTETLNLALQASGLDLFGRALLAVDGTRIKAVNNKDRNFTTGSLR